MVSTRSHNGNVVTAPHQIVRMILRLLARTGFMHCQKTCLSLLRAASYLAPGGEHRETVREGRGRRSQTLGSIGGRAGIRTLNLAIMSRVLYR